MAAYRLLNNERVTPAALSAPHVQVTRQACQGRGVVLCVQDTMELDYGHHPSKRGLGPSGREGSHGLLQHSALAVTTDGQLLGALGLRWHIRQDHGESIGRQSTRQRRARWRESLLWSEMAEQVGEAPSGCRFIHVMDAAGDVFHNFAAAIKPGDGFVIRASQDRCVNDHNDYLRSQATRWPIVAKQKIRIPARKGSTLHAARQARKAVVGISFQAVQLDPPFCDAKRLPPQPVSVVHVRELDPPEGVEPIDWTLLTSEPVTNADDARRIIAWYRCRWIIEEWHRAIKSGCQLEQSQLDHADDLKRLAALTAVQAVRLIQLRDLAGEAGVGATEAPGPPRAKQANADSPQALQATVPWLYILVASQLPKRRLDPLTMTARQFYRTIAKRGGWLGRKCDGRPGWTTLWRGWQELVLLVQGAQLDVSDIPPPRCV